MKEAITSFLLSHSKKTIVLEELDKFAHCENLTYQDFAQVILQLEEFGVLECVKSKGRTSKKPNLAYTYRINQAVLKEEQFKRLQSARLVLDKRIQLDRYFQLSSTQFEKDEPFLKKISEYLRSSGLPQDRVPAPERSFELVGDEKWITDGGGGELLKRIRLWDQMRVIPVADPLMLAVDVSKGNNKIHDHLIVENKTTYQGLLPVLKETKFTTLIYGSGRKILRGMDHFHEQVPLLGQHQFYYFGDLDLEGINIWSELTEKIEVLPATSFYSACMTYAPVRGKRNHRLVEHALESFLKYMNDEDKQKVMVMFEKGHYLPQEVLKTNVLQQLWREW